MVKNLPAVWETWVQFLGWEDPPEKGTAVHSSVLAWRIPWAEEPGRLHSPWGHKELDTTEQLSPFFLKLHFPVFIAFTSLKFYLCLFRQATIIQLGFSSLHIRKCDSPPYASESASREKILGKEMITHSSIFAWRFPWAVEPGRLWFIGLQRVRHNCSNLPCMHTRTVYNMDKQEGHTVQHGELQSISCNNLQ